MVGCYNGNPDVKDADRHGVDFTLRGPAFVIGEVGYRRNYGNVKLGAYFNGSASEQEGGGPGHHGCGPTIRPGTD
jgi:hypothetical protein